MDQFYLENAALYRALIKTYKPPPASEAANLTANYSNPNITVGARIRPLLDEDIAAGFPPAIFPRNVEAGVVDIHDLYNHPRGRPILKSFNYKVDRLFGQQTTTEEIYDSMASKLVPFAWNGGIGTLFAYGQTGSGKTFTISRLEQLVVESLMDEALEGQRQVYITIIELVGNTAYDLSSSRKPISILEDSFGVTQLAGADEHLVQDRKEIMDLIERAATFRRTAPTFKNDSSSRSHGICRIRVKNQSTNSEGFLYLIDLAGSEAARDVAVHGAERMRETREINISLSVLKDCIRGKVQSDIIASSGKIKAKQKPPHVPFRQSALTKVLKHVFDPAESRKCTTAVIACVNPSLADVGPSKNTLRYAELLRIPTTNTLEQGPTSPSTWTNAQLKSWIDKNSNGLPMLSALLAPRENGAELLRVPAAEYERRCLQIPGASSTQASALRFKLWQMHINPQRTEVSLVGPASNSSPSTDPIFGVQRSDANSRSSRDLDHDIMSVPFQERIRPGMVVRWNPSASGYANVSMPSATKMAMVLCPAEAVSNTCRDFLGSTVNGGVETEHSPSVTRYLCALVMKSHLAGAYELNVWRQIVIDVSIMEEEVILEYDTGTRYYYISDIIQI